MPGIDLKTIGLPLLLAGIAIGGYFAGAHLVAPTPSTPGQKDALAERALAMGDDAFGRNLLKKLAATGNGQAEYQLGELYRTGNGGVKDPRRAIVFLTKAADAGNADAERQLGQIYLDGRIAVQDFARARQWLGKAAGAGNPDAARLLGDMDAQGLGNKADPVSAYAWYEVAALNGDAYAAIERDKLLETLTPAQQRLGERDAAVRMAKLPAASSGPVVASGPTAKTPVGSATHS